MRHHHEKFDGSGYPDGLAGKEIPIGARVICVADTFMVITDGRPYRRPRSVSEAIAELERCSGSQFDPEVVQAFLRLNPAAMRSILNAGDVPDKQRILQTISPHPLWTRLVRSKGIFCLR
jgi:HD-GYP domain-containing protein (c-di-GMP phosphodiesterase class II)